MRYHLHVAIFITLAVVGLGGCNSKLKLITKAVDTATTDPENNSSNDPATKEKEIDNTNSAMNDFSLAVLADDGTKHTTAAVLNSAKPSIEIVKATREIKTVDFVIAQEANCRQPLFQFDLSAKNQYLMDFLADGVYFLCIFGFDANEQKVAGANNGLKITLDRQPPRIKGETTYFWNTQASTNLEVIDLTFVSYTWKQVGGPGTITIENSAILNPFINAPSDGTYDLKLILKDEANNLTETAITVTRDTNPPVLSAINLESSASDGYINISEINDPAKVVTTSGSGYDSVRFAFLTDGVSAACDGNTPLTLDAPPAIGNIPAADGTYRICVKVSDKAGNAIYSVSGPIIRDTLPPSIDAGTTITTNVITNTSPTVTGAINFTWQQISGPGILTLGDPTALITSVSASVDGVYTLELTATDQAGNSSQDTVILNWDSTPPSFTGLTLTGLAIDTKIDAAEHLSPTPFLSLSAGGYSEVRYTTPLNASVICNNSQSYVLPSLPLVSDISSDGDHAVCVRLRDGLGNTTYGKSATVTRDILAPTFTSLNGSNEALDGFINTTESSSGNALFALVASGYTTDSYTTMFNDAANSACTDSYAYSETSIPAPNSLPAVDGVYAICVKLNDDAGNTTYGKSQRITRDTSPPIFSALSLANEASDGYINTAESLSLLDFAQLSANEYTLASYTAIMDDAAPFSCNASQTYGNTSIPSINSVGPSAGIFAMCVRLVDEAGNITYGKSASATKDTNGPIFTSLNTINGAADGYVNITEYLSPAPLLELTASDFNTVSYSGILVDEPIICDSSKSYTYTSIPSISDVPASDATYVVCVKLTDNSGNTAYGKSTSFIRDIQPPTITLFISANEAADGYINIDESSSTQAFTTLTSSGSTSIAFSDILPDGSLTCDASQIYGNTSAPDINSISATGTFAQCVKLSDSANNIIYGKSNSVVKDTTPPSFTSLALLHAAITDGYLNASELGATGDTFTVNASGYSSAHFTTFLPSGTLICDNSLTYITTMPQMEDFPATDGSYAACVRISDNAGNTTYGLSSPIVRDTVGPTIISFLGANEASDSIINAGESASSNAMAAMVGSDYVQADYSNIGLSSALTCDNGLSYGNASIPSISSYNSDGVLAMCVKLTDAVGNVIYGKSASITRDTSPPVVNSFSPINAGADNIVNISESSSASPAYELDASDYVTASFSVFFVYATVTCNDTVTYDQSSIPAINSMPAADGMYGVCAKLEDSSGNITYRKSSILSKDILAPDLTNIDLINAASDGQIIGNEANSNLNILFATVSDYQDQYYTGYLSNDPPVTCDNSKLYMNSSVPIISSVPVNNGVYVVCVRFRDSAGNTTYGKSPTITRYTPPPASVTISGAPTDVGNTNSPNISIGGTDVSHYRYKFGVASSTDCASSANYGAEASVATPITEDLSAIADGPIKLCVIGRNVNGSWMDFSNAAVRQWIKDPNAPGTPSVVSLTPGNSTITGTITPSGIGTPSGYLIIVSTLAGQTWNISHGAPAPDLGWPITMALHSNEPMFDFRRLESWTEPLINGETYYVQVFAHSAIYTYSAPYPEQIVTLSDPQPPLLYDHLFDNAILNSYDLHYSLWASSMTPNFKVETQFSDSQSFSTLFLQNIDTFTESNFVGYMSGELFAENSYYYWRSRLSIDGGVTWTPFTPIRSFRYVSTSYQLPWVVDSQFQFDTTFPTRTNTSSFGTNGGEVYLSNPSATTGSITSTPLFLQDLSLDQSPWTGWGMIHLDTQWNSGEYAGNSCSVQIEYSRDLGLTWTLVPDSVLPGNLAGFNQSSIHLAGLDPKLYYTIRVRVNFSRANTSQTGPKLRAITLSPQKDARSVFGTNSLTNGSFELVDDWDTTWVISRTQNAGTAPTINVNYSGDAAQSGTKYARLTNLAGTLDFQREGYIHQTFKVPSGHTRLYFWVKYQTNEDSPCLEARINGSTSEMYQMCSYGTPQSSDWVLQSLDVSNYQNSLIHFSFGFSDNGPNAGAASHASWYGIDNVYTAP